jgi:hypothetical protein
MEKTGFIIALLALTVPVTKAEIVSGSVTGGTALTNGGVFVKLTTPLLNPFGVPNSVGDDNFQSPDLFGFDEAQNVLLAAPLTADVGTSPIPAGTTVSSHYIFFDPGPTEQVIGTVTFDSDIIGIMTSTATLAASDFLAAPGVNYLGSTSRGLEAGDSVTISAANQILVDVVASSPGDYVRVLTVGTSESTVPEPTGLAWLVAGIALIATLLKPNRHRKEAPINR